MEEITDEELSKFALEDTVRLILDASIRLQFNAITRCKALLIYHHFRRYDKNEFKISIVAAACLSLSNKFHGENAEFDSIIMICFCLVDPGVHKSTQDEEFKIMRKAVKKMECWILRLLDFLLIHRLAHEYLPYFLNDIREELILVNIWNVVAESTVKIASDFYFTNRCLNYKAEEIATAVIQAALYLSGYDANDENCVLNTRLKSFSNCPESRRIDIIEDIFMTCDVVPAAEERRITS